MATDWVSLYLHVPRELRERIRQEAVRDQRSLANWVTLALTDYIDAIDNGRTRK